MLFLHLHIAATEEIFALARALIKFFSFLADLETSFPRLGGFYWFFVILVFLFCIVVNVLIELRLRMTEDAGRKSQKRLISAKLLINIKSQRLHAGFIAFFIFIQSPVFLLLTRGADWYSKFILTLARHADP